ncbi:hypothetical protein [Vibrio breoganii]|uniref:hypothetical protein n=1 Tax=Vibrio breoganii TaxID=553239 RepID=UPI000C838D63|nr:hypothetical protein [Vibrio breoganii]PMH20688.1 hypothetical protein BCU74_18405 [Vibrio breoganii]PMM16946.1 hypothetical protein BCT60_18385 [Vibrio breoganii]
MAQMGSMPKKDKVPLSEGLSSLHHTTQRLIRFEKRKFIDQADFSQKLDISLNDPTDKSYRSDVVRVYDSLYRTYTELTEEEALINRMERRAHIRNTLFRGITTLVIGFSIMLVYWAAAKLEIAMPLMRLPL